MTGRSAVDDRDAMLALVIVPVFILASVAMEGVAARRCRGRIQQWASANAFQVGSVKRLWLSAGTWGIWSGGRSRRYFNVAVSDRTGSEHTGTVKIFGGFGGVEADEIEVRWQPGASGSIDIVGRTREEGATAASGSEAGDVSRTDRRVAAVAHLGIPIYSVLLPFALSKMSVQPFRQIHARHALPFQGVFLALWVVVLALAGSGIISWADPLLVLLSAFLLEVPNAARALAGKPPLAFLP